MSSRRTCADTGVRRSDSCASTTKSDASAQRFVHLLDAMTMFGHASTRHRHAPACASTTPPATHPMQRRAACVRRPSAAWSENTACRWGVDEVPAERPQAPADPEFPLKDCFGPAARRRMLHGIYPANPRAAVGCGDGGTPIDAYPPTRSGGCGAARAVGGVATPRTYPDTLNQETLAHFPPARCTRHVFAAAAFAASAVALAQAAPAGACGRPSTTPPASRAA